MDANSVQKVQRTIGIGDQAYFPMLQNQCGWFEYSFEFFAETLHVQPLTSGGNEIISPNLMMLDASGVILLAILILLGANKDTR